MDKLSVEWVIDHIEAGDDFLGQADRLLNSGHECDEVRATALAAVAAAHYAAAALVPAHRPVAWPT